MTDAAHAVWSGTFRIFGVDVRCHTLSDGQRVIEAESLQQLMEAPVFTASALDHDLEAFARWQRGR